MTGKKRKVRPPVPVVTFRTLSIDFNRRTVDLDGQMIQVSASAPALVIPILTGDAIFLPRGGWERVA